MVEKEANLSINRTLSWHINDKILMRGIFIEDDRRVELKVVHIEAYLFIACLFVVGLG